MPAGLVQDRRSASQHLNTVVTRDSPGQEQGKKKKSGPCKFLLSSEFSGVGVLNECSCLAALSSLSILH